MTRYFKCWEDGYSPETSDLIKACSIEQAAREYGSYLSEFDSDGDERPICIQEADEYGQSINNDIHKLLLRLEVTYITHVIRRN